MVVLLACGGDGGGGGTGSGCPPADELFAATGMPPTGVYDTNGNPNDMESITFVDRNGDGNVDAADGFDMDMNGVLDDINGDGRPDNRFYFDDTGEFIPDADSFDDYEDPTTGIPRGVTPVPGDCPADGVATGPIDLLGPDGRPRFTTWMPSHCCRRMR
jgi:hypothetical protein